MLHDVVQRKKFYTLVLQKCLTRSDVPDSIKMLTFSISQNKSLEKYRILSIKNTKLNKVMINLLLSKFTEAQIVKFLKKVSITNKKQFRTIHDYIDSIAKYYHSMI